MKKAIVFLVITVSLFTSLASADTFGTAGNQFTIDFVPISGDAGNLGSWDAGYTFSGVNHGDYRMGKYEITNDQYARFSVNNPTFTGGTVPANKITWHEAAQFVNYLNTSTGKPAAYKFSGNTFSVWDVTDAGYDASNPFRNSNAKYFLPTEDEWVKAAYWNGMSLQTWATPDNTIPTAGLESNYDSVVGQPWDVSSGSEELNGTYNMMGNVWEWMESPHNTGDYLSGSTRGVRGGSYNFFGDFLSSSLRGSGRSPGNEYPTIGFRVASVPEPTTLLLLGMGGLLIRKR